MNASGVQIFAGVLSGEMCDEFCERMKSELSHAHSDLMWQIRTLPSVIKCFEHVWQTDQLICGFDAISNGKPQALEWHTDQTFASDRCVCVQAMLALTDACSTEFVEYSHLTHRFQASHQFPLEGQWQFQRMEVSEHVFVIRPSLKRGDLIMWDSRVSHRVVEGTADRTVVYLSMVPRAFACPRTLRMRRHFYENGIATTHWPHILVDRGAEWLLPTKSYDDSSEIVRFLVDGCGSFTK